MSINIRITTEEDFPAILKLIKELAAFEKSPHKVTNTVDLMNEEKDLFKSFVAETDSGEIIGIAVYFFAYYTWVGKSLYLEDIYVQEHYRRQNIGTLLLDKIFKVAITTKCKRVRWQVLNWNSSAIQMYKKNGASIDDEWYNCNYDEEGIRRYCGDRGLI
jgi:GNAT superfamily N-acetyltransferase